MVGGEGLAYRQSLEDQFCRDVYQDLCVFAEFQHLRATALVSPGTTPLACPVDSLVKTHPSPPLGTQVTMETLDPCAWRYVLTQDDLASFRLKARSDVVGAWEIKSTTYNYFYCQVKIVVHAHRFTSSISTSRLFQMLKYEDPPYARCAWCDETPKTRSMLEEHYYEIHHVVLQPSCCAPPDHYG